LDTPNTLAELNTVLYSENHVKTRLENTMTANTPYIGPLIATLAQSILVIGAIASFVLAATINLKPAWPG
jgi:hypothetical protein